jgi:hypothetical protein
LAKRLFSIRTFPHHHSYVDQKFLQSYKATVGADFMEKEVIVDGKVINLEVHLALKRSGIPPDNKSSEAWVAPSIEEPTAVFWSMTSPTKRYHLS